MTENTEELRLEFIKRMDEFTENYDDLLADIFWNKEKQELRYPLLFKFALINNLTSYLKVKSKTIKGKKGKEDIIIFWSFDEVFGVFSEDLSKLMTAFQKKVGKFKCNLIDKQLKEKILTDVICYDLVGLKGEYKKQYYDTPGEGKFIRDQLGNLYYFFNDEFEPKIYFVMGSEAKIEATFNAFIHLRYNLINGKRIVEGLVRYGLMNFEEQDLQRNFFYDFSKNILYIHNRKNHVFKLDGNIIEKIPNGLEVMFRSVKGEEIIQMLIQDVLKYPEFEIEGLYFDTKNPKNMLWDCLINRANFIKKTALDNSEQLAQLLYYFYCLPFGSFMNTKPVLVFIGEFESGKTFTMDIMGKFLFDLNSSVQTILKDDQENFKTAVINKPVVMIDNLDKLYPWLEDMVCSIATGGSFPMRTLFKTAELSEFKPQCFQMITSRTPKFNRPDFSSRALPTYCGNIKVKVGESIMLKPLRENYTYLWNIYLIHLNKIVNVLGKSKNEPFTSSHRIADWIMVAKAVNDSLEIETKYEVKFNDIMEKIHLERAFFELWNIPLIDHLRTISIQKPNISFTSSDLLNELTELDMDIEMSAKTLGKLLTNKKRPLKTHLGLEIKKDSSLNQNIYIFVKTIESDIIITESINEMEDGFTEENEYTLTHNKNKNNSKIVSKEVHENENKSKNKYVLNRVENDPQTRKELDIPESIKHIWLDRIYSFTQHKPKPYPEIRLLMGSENWDKLKRIFDDFVDKGYVTESPKGLYAYNK